MTPEEVLLLERFVTTTEGDIFVLKNLPEVVKGALFSRYSRSQLGLRELLLKEFISQGESAFQALTHEDKGLQETAIQRAQNFYDRILDGYGDDSIGELGGAHLALENISMLAAKVVEDLRIGGSPLEKSTRYISFEEKQNGSYRYYREPMLMASAYRTLYIEMCDHLFSTYAALIPPMTDHIERRFPKQPELSEAAYKAALRAKVLDALRGLLPAATLTNMGLFANGRFWESLLHRLQSHPLKECQEIGKRSYEELAKVIPSFIRRAESHHRHHAAYCRFQERLKQDLKRVAESLSPPKGVGAFGITLVDCDSDMPVKIAAALLYKEGEAPLHLLLEYCRSLPSADLERVLNAACHARENRRHKSPRALEHVFVTFDIVADFGIYRDLHRHRMLTQERQLLTCNYGYYLPEEVAGTAMEAPYRAAMERAQEAYRHIARELPEEAQYVVPMAYNIRWYFHVNLRALQWLCELRSQPQGHPGYRWVAQEMVRQLVAHEPLCERFFKFVDHESYALGRMAQEERNARRPL